MCHPVTDVPLLTQLFQKFLNISFVPQAWKLATIVSLPKAVQPLLLLTLMCAESQQQTLLSYYYYYLLGMLTIWPGLPCCRTLAVPADERVLGSRKR